MFWRITFVDYCRKCLIHVEFLNNLLRGQILLYIMVIVLRASTINILSQLFFIETILPLVKDITWENQIVSKDNYLLVYNYHRKGEYNHTGGLKDKPWTVLVLTSRSSACIGYVAGVRGLRTLKVAALCPACIKIVHSHANYFLHLHTIKCTRLIRKVYMMS